MAKNKDTNTKSYKEQVKDIIKEINYEKALSEIRRDKKRAKKDDKYLYEEAERKLKAEHNISKLDKKKIASKIARERENKYLPKFTGKSFKKKISSGKGVTPKAIPATKIMKSFAHTNYVQIKEPKDYSKVPIQDNRSLFFRSEWRKEGVL